MKTIKKEIEVVVCELCGKELNSAICPVEVFEDKDNITDASRYAFHQECVDKLLIKEAKKLIIYDKN